MKTMIVHDEGESDAGSTPCKDSTLIVRQVLTEKKKIQLYVYTSHIVHCILLVVLYFVHSYPKCFSTLFTCVDHFLFLNILCGRWRRVTWYKVEKHIDNTADGVENLMQL